MYNLNRFLLLWENTKSWDRRRQRHPQLSWSHNQNAWKRRVIKGHLYRNDYRWWWNYHIFGKDSKYNIGTFDDLLKTVYSKNMISAVAITNDDTTYDESIKFDRFITLQICYVLNKKGIKSIFDESIIF